MSYLLSLFKQNRRALLLIYFYALAAQLLFLAEPYIIGKTIDGLLAHQYEWLIALLALEIAVNVFTYKRMVYDTKVFTHIYNNIVIDYLKQDTSTDTSSKTARTDMAHYITHFLEDHLQYYIMSVVSIIGTLCFIFIENTLTGFVVATSTIPIVYIVHKFYKKIEQAARVSNAQQERKVVALETNNMNIITRFFARRANIVIAESTLQGKNWLALNSIKSAFLVAALILFTSGVENLTQGETLALYSYVTQFLISLMSIPVAMNMIAEIRDVLKRLLPTITKS